MGFLSGYVERLESSVILASFFLVSFVSQEDVFISFTIINPLSVFSNYFHYKKSVFNSYFNLSFSCQTSLPTEVSVVSVGIPLGFLLFKPSIL